VVTARRQHECRRDTEQQTADHRFIVALPDAPGHAYELTYSMDRAGALVRWPGATY
jgi:hypothetical protein